MSFCRGARGSRREISSFLRGLGQSVYGLLVDDGQLAIGAIVALAITWLIAAAGERLRAEAGWVLLALAVAVVVANVYVAGLRARRRSAAAPRAAGAAMTGDRQSD